MMECYSAVQKKKKKECDLSICDNTNGSGGCYAKWNNSDRERQIPYDFTCMWDLKNKADEHANEQTWNRLKYREPTAGCQRSGEWGTGDTGKGDWEVQTLSYRINETKRWKTQHRQYSQWCANDGGVDYRCWLYLPWWAWWVLYRIVHLKPGHYIKTDSDLFRMLN